MIKSIISLDPLEDESDEEVEEIAPIRAIRLYLYARLGSFTVDDMFRKSMEGHDVGFNVINENDVDSNCMDFEEQVWLLLPQKGDFIDLNRDGRNLSILLDYIYYMSPQIELLESIPDDVDPTGAHTEIIGNSGRKITQDEVDIDLAGSDEDESNNRKSKKHHRRTAGKASSKVHGSQSTLEDQR